MQAPSPIGVNGAPLTALMLSAIPLPTRLGLAPPRTDQLEAAIDSAVTAWLPAYAR
jgi:hypothetical protein